MMRPNARSPSITSQESYSAVMITDLIADVPVNPDMEQEGAKSTKEQTNLAYDGHLDEKANSAREAGNSLKANGAGISRGVILNAVQFGQPDAKSKNDEKPIQLTAALPVPALARQTSELKGFKDMSFQRKIAFGFSFLPSILFVLCFAVILPCNVPKSCVQESWVKIFNNTQATSKLEISENIVFTALKESGNVLLELNKGNGKPNEIKLPSSAAYLKCGKIMNEDKTDCIVMDKSGSLYTFNNSHSKLLWDRVSETDKSSSPVFLSGCTAKLEDVAVAVSPTEVKVLHGGNKISSFKILNCDSVPVLLTPWTVNGSSDILFVCDKDGEDRLVKVPKNVWCTFASKTPEDKHMILKKGALNSIKTSIVQPLEDGLILWSSDEASMILPNGTISWTVSNLSHSEENRFILYGKFNGENKQLTFFSSNLMSGLKVTLLDLFDGSFVKSGNYLDVEAAEVMHIQGKKKDFALLLLKKMKIIMDTVTTAFTQINDISTTIVNLLSNEDLQNGTAAPVSEELALLDLDGNLDTLQEIKDLKDSNNKSTMAVISDKDTGILSIYLLSTLDNSQIKTTEVRNINVENWDKSTKSKCLAK